MNQADTNRTTALPFSYRAPFGRGRGFHLTSNRNLTCRKPGFGTPVMCPNLDFSHRKCNSAVSELVLLFLKRHSHTTVNIGHFRSLSHA